jgi:redox-sensitive bicupin YhaK (pirin superfamily)
MSGPVASRDAPDLPEADTPVACDVEVIEGREGEVGGVVVHRLLPRRPRRTVSSWCFADHLGPATVSEERGLDIGPHPHIGLQTVTWLLQGAILHRDSLGSEQVIRPGELNLMTAGHGVAHSEETTDVPSGVLHGVQLWVAQPAATRDTGPAFQHHRDLPQVEVVRGVATVLVGRFLGATSAARRDTDHLGVELDLERGETTIPLEPDLEYGVLAVDGSVLVAGCPLDPPALGYLGTGRAELRLEVGEPARVLLLGGPPFPEPLLMWWNYVARSRAEVAAAHESWRAGDGRFGPVASPLAPMTAPDLPWG